jgi:hypothetical protein
VSGDAPLKALRRDDCFDRVVRACPLQAHWLDGRPLTGVVAMAGVMDRIHDYVVDGDQWSPASPPSATPGRAPTRPRAAA